MNEVICENHNFQAENKFQNNHLLQNILYVFELNYHNKLISSKSKKTYSSKEKNVFADFDNIEKFGNFYNFIYKNFKAKNDFLNISELEREEKYTIRNLFSNYLNKYLREEKTKGIKEFDLNEFLFNKLSTNFFRKYNDFSGLYFIKTSTKIMEIYLKIIILETNGNFF